MLLILSLTTGCSNAGSGDSSLKVGVLAPETGRDAALGADVLTAIRLAEPAVRDYLAQNEITLEIAYMDTESDEATAVSRLKRLEAQEVDVIIGPCSSPTAKACSEAAAPGTILVSPTSTAPSLAEKENLLRVALNDSHQAASLVKLMDFEEIDVALVAYVDDLYGRELSQAFEAEARKVGIGTASLSVPPGVPDPAGVISELDMLDRQRQADAQEETVPSIGVFFIGSLEETETILSALDFSEPMGAHKWYVSEAAAGSDDLFADIHIARMAAMTRLEGFAFSPHSTEFSIGGERALNRIEQAAEGSAPLSYALTAWDALWLAANARVDQSRSGGMKQNIIDASKSFFGATGFIRLDEKGERTEGAYVLKRIMYRNGAIRWNNYGVTLNKTSKAPLLTDIRDGSPKYPATEYDSPLRIGALLPLTGGLAQRGAKARSALAQAVEDANYFLQKKGYPYTVALESLDTATSADGALAALAKLHTLGVKVVIGPYTSEALEAVKDFVQENDIYLISPFSTASSLSLEDNIIRLIFNDAYGADALSRHLEARGTDELIVIHRQDAYGQSYLADFKTYYPRTIDAVGYAPDTADFSSHLQTASDFIKMGAANPVIVLIGLDETADILLQSRTNPALQATRWYLVEASSTFGDNNAVLEMVKTATITNMVAKPQGYGIFIPHSASLSYQLGDSGLDASALNSYDALWVAAMGIGPAIAAGDEPLLEDLPSAGYQELASVANWSHGLSGPLFLNRSGDRTTVSYGFERAKINGEGTLEWDTGEIATNTGFHGTVQQTSGDDAPVYNYWPLAQELASGGKPPWGVSHNEFLARYGNCNYCILTDDIPPSVTDEGHSTFIHDPDARGVSRTVARAATSGATSSQTFTGSTLTAMSGLTYEYASFTQQTFAFMTISNSAFFNCRFIRCLFKEVKVVDSEFSGSRFSETTFEDLGGKPEDIFVGAFFEDDSAPPPPGDTGSSSCLDVLDCGAWTEPQRCLDLCASTP